MMVLSPSLIRANYDGAFTITWHGFGGFDYDGAFTTKVVVLSPLKPIF
jgi:hypothetical protein